MTRTVSKVKDESAPVISDCALCLLEGNVRDLPFNAFNVEQPCVSRMVCGFLLLDGTITRNINTALVIFSLLCSIIIKYSRVEEVQVPRLTVFWD